MSSHSYVLSSIPVGKIKNLNVGWDVSGIFLYKQPEERSTAICVLAGEREDSAVGSRGKLEGENHWVGTTAR